jgi:excisionase family DNA binding protein
LTGRLLTAREVSEMLAVSPETVLRWTRRGQLPAFRLPGGAIRYREPDVDAWLDAHSTTAGDGTEEASPASDATRQPGVSLVTSPVSLRPAAPTEEN